MAFFKDLSFCIKKNYFKMRLLHSMKDLFKGCEMVFKTMGSENVKYPKYLAKKVVDFYDGMLTEDFIKAEIYNEDEWGHLVCCFLLLILFKHVETEGHAIFSVLEKTLLSVAGSKVLIIVSEASPESQKKLMEIIDSFEGTEDE